MSNILRRSTKKWNGQGVEFQPTKSTAVVSEASDPLLPEDEDDNAAASAEEVLRAEEEPMVKPIVAAVEQAVDILRARLDSHMTMQRENLSIMSQRMEATLERIVLDQQQVSSSVDVVRGDVRSLCSGLEHLTVKSNGLHEGELKDMKSKLLSTSEVAIDVELTTATNPKSAKTSLPEPPAVEPKRKCKEQLITHGSVVRIPVSACRNPPPLPDLPDSPGKVFGVATDGNHLHYAYLASPEMTSNGAAYSSDDVSDGTVSMNSQMKPQPPGGKTSQLHMQLPSAAPRLRRSILKDLPDLAVHGQLPSGAPRLRRSVRQVQDLPHSSGVEPDIASIEHVDVAIEGTPVWTPPRPKTSRCGTMGTDISSAPSSMLDSSVPSSYPEGEKKLMAGDLVRITKESRQKHKKAKVVDPSWNGMVKVRMESGEDKGAIKSYGAENLEILERDVHIKPHHRPKNLVLSLAWPSNVKMRKSFQTSRHSQEIEDILAHDAHRNSRRQAPRFLINSDSNLFAHDASQRKSGPGQTTTKFGRAVSEGALARQPQQCVLNPSSLPRLYIDLFSIIVLAYDLVMTPYILAWDVPMEGWLTIGMWVTCIFWTFDIFFSLRTGFWSHGNLEMRPKKIMRHYVVTWGPPDLTLVITDWASNLMTLVLAGPRRSAKTVSLLRLSKAGKLIRVLGVLRMAKLSELFERLSFLGLLRPDGRHEIFVQIPQLFMLIVWVNHVIGCAWFAVGRLAPSDTGYHWLDTRISGEVSRAKEFFLVRPATYRDADQGYQYSTAVHWALCQMTPGSMQVHASNSYERNFNNITLILGLMFFGSLISMLTAKMTQYRMLKQAKTSTILTLRRFLHQNHLSKTLAVAVQKQVMDRISAPKLLKIQDVPALSILSLSLRTELEYELCRPHLVGHSFFLLCDKVDDTLMRHLCLKAIEILVIAAQDNVFLAGSQAEHGYCVAQGHLEYTQEPKTSKVSSTTRSFVVSGDWLSEIALYAHWSHVGTVEASSSCELLVMGATAVADALAKQALIWQATQAYAHSFHNILVKSAPPKSWPTDLHRDVDEIFAGMSLEVKSFMGLIAIDVLKRDKWRFKLGYESIFQLEDEVRSGHCCLVLKSTQVFRIISLSSLLLRRDDGRILAQLARIKDDTVRVECLLPSKKHESQEEPDKAVQRLLKAKLWPLEEGICIGDSLSKSEVRTSTTKKLPTRYLITQFESHLQHGFEFPQMTILRPVAMSKHRSLSKSDFTSHSSTGSGISSKATDGCLPSAPVFLIDCSEANIRYLFAWLTPEEFDTLGASHGKKMLNRWISSLAIESEDGAVLSIDTVHSEITGP